MEDPHSLAADPAPNDEGSEDTLEAELESLLLELEKRVRVLVEDNAPRREVWRQITLDLGYQKLLEQHGRALWNKAGQELAEILELEDISAEVTLLLLNRNQGEEEFPWKPNQRLSHWLRVVLANACREVCRSFSRPARVLRLGDQDRDVLTTKKVEAQAKVHRAILTLEDPHKTVMWLHIALNTQQNHIADQLERSTSWVSRVVAEGIGMLREILGE